LWWLISVRRYVHAFACPDNPFHSHDFSFRVVPIRSTCQDGDIHDENFQYMATVSLQSGHENLCGTKKQDQIAV
jgi:hypothetical protein